jgi:hypothetical protein
MQTHPDLYQPYLETSVADYCKEHVDPANCEIENVSLTAVFDVLVKPAGVGIEILYLDRSPGATVTPYTLNPVNEAGQPLTNFPIFSLLYRPYVLSPMLLRSLLTTIVATTISSTSGILLQPLCLLRALLWLPSLMVRQPTLSLVSHTRPMTTRYQACPSSPTRKSLPM